MSASKERKDARAKDPKNQKQGRKKGKLIRLDDLIPKQNVLGGRQVVFGATDTSENQPKKQE